MNTRQKKLHLSFYRIACLLASAAVILLVTEQRALAEAPANGTTVFRCIDISGIVSFADAPCKDSASTRLRIEHSLIQSAPISMGEQQRLRALEQRLKVSRAERKSDSLTEHKRKRAAAQAGDERCRQAQLGLAEIRSRKRRGYPASQAKRIDNEEQALRGEIGTYCSG